MDVIANRYLFYVTNDWEMTDHQVVGQARGRCDQENLIAQLKGQVRALHAPVHTLVANWAYMAMAALHADKKGQAQTLHKLHNSFPSRLRCL